MELENVNVVGKDSETMLNHIFECHDELRQLKSRLNGLSPLLSEVDRRADKERAREWKPYSGEAFTVTIDQEMWEVIRQFV